ncbi:TBPIP-domain-containing protein [Gonapodya prolifera JEL478]|uniref:TBPIP-domain-containing protein n=1 Tax=Gonapodya prolifera (strain JEL478) TaxID=1344416 RepID=A0A139A5I8_GONPJ|nr:TBPIP-domain-containing protein [Gonapodya prolifera JEL478]|eukprot:KXS12014.1 TBPIP-domain-containing protein [Gonapodya prolifera JEL478]
MGKPTKDKAPQIKGDEAEIRILEYLKEQNRPYSAIDVANNLHGTIALTQTKKILQHLADSEKIECKTYGKAQVYVRLQDDVESPSEDQLSAMDLRLESLKEQVSEAKDNVKTREKQLAILSSSPVTEEAKKRAIELRIESSLHRTRLTTLRNQTPVLSRADMAKVDAQLGRFKFMWARRRSLCRVLVGTVVDVADSCGAERDGGGRIRKDDIVEESGIDTDEMCDVNFETFENEI